MIESILYNHYALCVMLESNKMISIRAPKLRGEVAKARNSLTFTPQYGLHSKYTGSYNSHTATNNIFSLEPMVHAHVKLPNPSL